MRGERKVTPIDTHYTGRPNFAASYLLTEGDEAVFVELNTTHAAPHLLRALDDQGFKPEQVRYLIVTHVHLDHAGGASEMMARCPHATLLAHPRAVPHLVDPTRLVASATQVYGEALFKQLYGEIGPVEPERVRAMEDGERLRWGSADLVFLHTRGHADHHFCIHDEGTNGVFTGDALGIGYPRLQADGRFFFPTTSPTDFHAEEARRSVHRIAGTGAERAWLTHFGGFSDVPGIAAALDVQLQVYGRLADEAFAEVSDADLDEWCSARVQAQFEALLDAHPGVDTPENREMLAVDRALNAQGLAFSVRRRWRRAARSQGTGA